MNYKTPRKAIITDAGFASRYLPITKTIPKGMMPIGNKPVMQLVVEECAASGVTTEDQTDRFIRIAVGVCGAIMGFIILNAGDFEISTFIRFFGAYMLVVGIGSFIYGIHNFDQKQEDRVARKESAKKAIAKKSAKKTKKK